MGREVRKVPADWEHPKYIHSRRGEIYKPLFEWSDGCGDDSECMPSWKDEEKTHYMMYENTTEGTPISPAFLTPEELATWLYENKASACGCETASYEGWLRVAKGGYAPSMISSRDGLINGVDGLK